MLKRCWRCFLSLDLFVLYANLSGAKKNFFHAFLSCGNVCLMCHCNWGLISPPSWRFPRNFRQNCFQLPSICYEKHIVKNDYTTQIPSIMRDFIIFVKHFTEFLYRASTKKPHLMSTKSISINQIDTFSVVTSLCWKISLNLFQITLFIYFRNVLSI